MPSQSERGQFGPMLLSQAETEGTQLVGCLHSDISRVKAVNGIAPTLDMWLAVTILRLNRLASSR